MTSISDDRKGRGRPRVGSTHIGVRLPPDQLAALDAWIARQPAVIGRPEAMRQLSERGLAYDQELTDRLRHWNGRVEPLVELSPLLTPLSEAIAASDEAAMREAGEAIIKWVLQATDEARTELVVFKSEQNSGGDR